MKRVTAIIALRSLLSFASWQLYAGCTVTVCCDEQCTVTASCSGANNCYGDAKDGTVSCDNGLITASCTEE